MQPNIKIDENNSIILSYHFLYDNTIVMKGIKDKTIINNNLEYENLLNYVDRLYSKNKIFEFKNISGNKLFILNNKYKLLHELKIIKIYIQFFSNNIAFLNIELNSNEKDISRLYDINKRLTSFYTKKVETYITIGDDNLHKIDKKCVKNNLKDYVNLYNPDINKKPNDYPFSNNNDLKHFKGRVGPSSEEKYCITIDNDNILNDNYHFNINRHYLYFENHIKLIKKEKKEHKKIYYINYNTFITSLIIKYVKPNDGVLFYDNFNPIATNYINSYITLSCDSDIFKDEYNNNFISFEPLLSSKTNKGKYLFNIDYFNIYQSQTDIFTIGNSHNIVNILDKNIDINIKNNKKSMHFYTYQLSQLQRVSILRIINASILNIENIVGNISIIDRIKKSWKSFKMTNKTISDYSNFLTNINFSIISNSSSIDNSYQFFRKCNEVNLLTSQWNNISFKLKDSKSILLYVLGKYAIFAIISLILLSIYSKDIINYIETLVLIFFKITIL